jgi:aminoglycoside/choline kinase family phosphotransferase
VSDVLDPRITAYLDEQGLTTSVVKVVALTGDASDRRYFRVLLADHDPIVLSLHAGPIDVETLPFVLVARLLRAIPLPVPAILHYSNALGILGLQDLGDVTLQAHLGVASRAEHAALYRQAVGFVATLQQRGLELASNEYPPYGVAFDVEKLTWELEFYVKQNVMAYRGVSLSDTVRAALREECGHRARARRRARVLCHRDYHSRNLMLHQGSLYIIDFQDARMGPDTYDLVSLLRDSYVDLTPSQVDELIAYFLALSRAYGAGPADAAEFRRRFDLMALQRNLKALGTFGYQTTARGNPVYIQYIPRTLSYVGANLGSGPRFARLPSCSRGRSPSYARIEV